MSKESKDESIIHQTKAEYRKEQESKKNIADKMLRNANIRNRDMLLVLALHYIHTKGLEPDFLAYLETWRGSVAG